MYQSFDPRPRTGGDVTDEMPPLSPWQFRPTPPYRGRLDAVLIGAGQHAVSTHAPVPGATHPRGSHIRRPRVSTHAPVPGATRGCRYPAGPPGRFDPRPRTGGDSISGRGHQPRNVSTHAPVPGATGLPSRPSSIRSFDPRPRTGGDHGGVAVADRHAGFDPRPRTGGDCQAAGGAFRCAAVSTHAPVPGATAGQHGPLALHPGFDPRPRTGGDALMAYRTMGCISFDPRPRTGGDHSIR